MFIESQANGDMLRLRLADQVTRAVELDEVLQTACEGLTQTLGYAASAIFVADAQRRSAVMRAWAGKAEIARRFEQAGQAPIGWVSDISGDTCFARLFRNHQAAPLYFDALPELLNDLTTNPAARKLGGTLNALLRLQKIVVFPVVISGQVWAAQIIASQRALDQHDLDAIQVIMGQINLAIERAQRHAQLQQRNRELIRRTNQLTSLQTIIQAATSTLDPRHVMETVAQGMVERLGYRASLVSTFYAKDNYFVMGAVHPGGELLERAIKLLGYDPWSLRFYFNPDDAGITRLRRGEVWITSRFHDLVHPVISRPIAAAMQKLYGTRCTANVPMWVRGQLVGTIIVATQDETINQEDQDMLLTVARQVGLAIDNARLYQQAQDERSRLQLLYDIGQQLTSQLEIKQLLPVLVDTVVQSVGADKGGILVFAPEKGDFAPKKGDFAPKKGDFAPEKGDFAPEKGDFAPEKEGFDLAGQVTHHILIRDYDSEEQAQSIIEQVLKTGIAGRAVRERRAILTSDTQVAPLVAFRPDQPQDVNIRSMISVPLLLPKRVVGLLTLVHHQPNYFTPDHLQVLEALAAQATTALENARLYEQTARYARQQSAVAEAARALNAHLNVQDAFAAVVESLRALVDARRISLVLREGQKDYVRYIALDSPLPEPLRGMAVPLSASSASDTLLAGRPHLTPDLSVETDHPLERELYAAGFRSRVNLPLIVGEQVIGALNLSSPREAAFSARDLTPLQQIADALASALSNSRLIDQVRDSELRYRTLTENAPVGIFSIDASGRITAVNPALIQLLSLPNAEAFLGEEILKYPPLQKAGLVDDFRAALERGITADQEIQYTDSDRVSWHFRLKLAPERDASGQVNVVVGLLENISERAALEQLREDLRAMLIHDLRQPLAIIHTALALAAEEALAPGIQRLINDALNNAQRQQTLIEAYLDVTRLEAGQMPFVLAPTPWPEVEKLIQKTINALQATASRRELLVELQSTGTPASDWQVRLDHSAIERVLLNLLDNAIKFSKVGEQPITLLTHADSAGLNIKVIDRGAGIPEDKLPNIFDRFAQARQGDRVRGTGLGLTFCKLAVEAHDGKIAVESAQGRGTTVSLWLPALKEPV
jgi:PAS domain S-box-containing protein